MELAVAEIQSVILSARYDKFGDSMNNGSPPNTRMWLMEKNINK